MLEVSVQTDAAQIPTGNAPIKLRDGERILASLTAEDALSLGVNLLHAKWFCDPEREPFHVSTPAVPAAPRDEIARVAVAVVATDHTADELIALVDFTPENLGHLIPSLIILARDLGEVAGTYEFGAVLERFRQQNMDQDGWDD